MKGKRKQVMVVFNSNNLWMYEMLSERVRMFEALGEVSSVPQVILGILRLKLKADWETYKNEADESSDVGRTGEQINEEEEEVDEGHSEPELPEGADGTEDGLNSLGRRLQDNPETQGQVDSRCPEGEGEDEGVAGDSIEP